jgi:cyclohexa-1,5-dienecarbonyl-CoA hydratase
MSVAIETDYQSIKMSVQDGVAELTLARPEYNVLNIAMMEEINSALEALNAGRDLKALVIRAEGKVFSAGVDVAEHTDELAGKMIETFHRMFRLLDRFEAPTIAVVQGSALGGGCEVALFCDMVVASERAKFGQPEIKVGVFPPIAALRMPQTMTSVKAYEFLLTGASWKAPEMLSQGVINQVYPADEFQERSAEFVSALTAHSAVVIRLTKKALRRGLNRPFAEALFDVEEIYLKELMCTADVHEGLTAFMEKRPAKWANR